VSPSGLRGWCSHCTRNARSHAGARARRTRNPCRAPTAARTRAGGPRTSARTSTHARTHAPARARAASPLSPPPSPPLHPTGPQARRPRGLLLPRPPPAAVRLVRRIFLGARRPGGPPSGRRGARGRRGRAAAGADGQEHGGGGHGRQERRAAPPTVAGGRRGGSSAHTCAHARAHTHTHTRARARAHTHPTGDWVLVHAAAGGTGQLLVQVRAPGHTAAYGRPAGGGRPSSVPEARRRMLQVSGTCPTQGGANNA
jgi:hypothetical protein